MALDNFIPKNACKQCNLSLIHICPGKGIIFTMPLSSVSGVVSKILNRSAAREDWGREQEGTSMAEKGKNDLVVVVVNHGCTDLVMEAAQAAGARGGTVLHARRLGYEEGERSGEGAVRPEKEIVTILVPRSIRQMVMERVSTVSYTHLDVYKRQPPQCCRRHPSWRRGRR